MSTKNRLRKSDRHGGRHMDPERPHVRIHGLRNLQPTRDAGAVPSASRSSERHGPALPGSVTSFSVSVAGSASCVIKLWANSPSAVRLALQRHNRDCEPQLLPRSEQAKKARSVPGQVSIPTTVWTNANTKETTTLTGGTAVTNTSG